MSKAALGAVVLAALASPSAAAVYRDAISFAAALTVPPAVEGFDGLPAAEASVLGFGAFSMEESGGDENNVVVSRNRYFSFGNVSGFSTAAYADDGDSRLSFGSFDRAYTAFGFYLTASQDTVFEIATASHTVSVAFRRESAPLFIGMTDLDLNGVTVTASGAPRVSFDDVAYGFAAPVEVPLPAGLGLLGAAMAGLGAFGLRSRIA